MKTEAIPIAAKHDARTSMYSSTGGRLTSSFSWKARQGFFKLFLKTFEPGPTTTVIDVGVTGSDRDIEDNYFEKLYLYTNMITGVGTEDASYLEERFPGFRYVRCDGRDLKFDDKSFDVAFCSAVVEHAGRRDEQEKLIHQICRVSSKAFVTTPNRGFFVEVHTNLPFLHYLPVSIHRKILASLGWRFFAKEENLNLLYADEFLALFPKDRKVRLIKHRLFGIFVSNLIAIVE